MRTTAHLKEFQFKPTVLKPGDKEVMKDMIKSGTKLDAFIEFWHKAGLTYSSARMYWYNIRKTIDNGVTEV